MYVRHIQNNLIGVITVIILRLVIIIDLKMMIRTTYQTLDKVTLDNLIEGYQLISFDWRYLYVNDAVVKQSKYQSKEDLLGYTMMEKYPGIEKTELFKVLEECMKVRTSKTMINKFTFPDDSEEWFELRIEPVPKGLFILSMDITERIMSERAKMDYINTLEEMLFMTSHKVRKPICNILGLFNMLDSTKTTKKRLLEIADLLRREIKDLNTFTKELTLFIERNKNK